MIEANERFCQEIDFFHWFSLFIFVEDFIAQLKNKDSVLT